MTISDNYIPLHQIGNSVTTQFSSDWAVLDSDYIRVYLESVATGIQTLQILGTDFTLVFSASGFTVTFTVAPTSANYVVIGRDVADDQTNPYSTSKGFQGPTLEDSLDKLTAITQDLRDITKRSVVAPVGDMATNLNLPPAPLRALHVLAFDSSGNTIVSDQTLTQIESGSASAQASAAAAATSAAAAAASVAALSGTSTSSIAIATGAKTFTTQTGKNFVNGEYLIISSNANSANYMVGQITSYNTSTGALVMNITSISGTGTHADWNIMITGPQGPQGVPGGSGTGYTEASITGTLTAVSGKIYVATGTATLNIPLSTGLTTAWSSLLLAEAGAVTIAPAVTDKINGGVAGASITIPQGPGLSIITTDAAGNIYVGFGSQSLLAGNNLSDLQNLGTALTNLGFDISGIGSGSYKFPGGLIIKWGTWSLPSTTSTQTFPVAFPNNNLFTSVQPTNSNSGGIALVAITGKTAAGATVFTPSTSTFDYEYFAIGN